MFLIAHWVLILTSQIGAVSLMNSAFAADNSSSTLASEFRALGLEAADELESEHSVAKRYPWILPDELRDVARTVDIVPVDVACITEKSSCVPAERRDAINIPKQRKILVERLAWNEKLTIEEKKALVVHEVLGILGLEKNEMTYTLPLLQELAIARGGDPETWAPISSGFVSPFVAQSNGTDRGGGDVFASEFKAVAQSLYRRIKGENEAVCPLVDPNDLKLAIENTQVNTVIVPCLTEVPETDPAGCPHDKVRTSIGSPQSGRMLLGHRYWRSLSRWDRIQVRENFVLHRYFVEIGLETEENYAQSTICLAAVRGVRLMSSALGMPQPELIAPKTEIGHHDVEVCQDRCDGARLWEINHCQSECVLGNSEDVDVEACASSCIQGLKQDHIGQCHRSCTFDANWQATVALESDFKFEPRRIRVVDDTHSVFLGQQGKERAHKCVNLPKTVLDPGIVTGHDYEMGDRREVSIANHIYAALCQIENPAFDKYVHGNSRQRSVYWREASGNGEIMRIADFEAGRDSRHFLIEGQVRMLDRFAFAYAARWGSVDPDRTAYTELLRVEISPQTGEIARVERFYQDHEWSPGNLEVILSRPSGEASALAQEWKSLSDRNRKLLTEMLK